MKMLIISVAFVAVAIAWFVATYNGLVKLRNQVKNAWSQIDVQLKRRHDLIPNLIETVKGYMDHEKETLELVTKARYAAVEAQGRRHRVRPSRNSVVHLASSCWLLKITQT